MAIKDPDDLYGLPLDRFVAERTALARGLRADGKREEATGVAALRKPSLAAWAVNQVARTQRQAVKELFEAGDRARGAQSDLIAGRGDAGALRDASHGERAAVDSLVDAARGLLSSEGHELSGPTLERVADTLHAAALDDDARAKVAEGRLERELKHVGLVGAIGAAPAPGGRRAKAPESTAARGGETKVREAPARRAREEARKAEEVRRAARVAEGEARRRLERAEKAVQVAEERRDRAAKSLEEAEGALAKARAEEQKAAEDHKSARAELEAS